MTSSCCSCHHAARTWPRWPPGPSNEAYLSSPHLEASPATTFRPCSSPAPTPVKPQPAPAILSQESVHTALSITHHTRKRPSTGPRTTHGPQSPPWWVHWQHPHIITRKKRKRKETNKKKLQQAIESQIKAKSKITWRRQVSDPLGKGNNTSETKLRSSKERRPPNQNSKNHKELPLHTCKLPLNQCNSPWTNACKPLEENRAAASAQLWPVRPVTTTGQTGAQHMNRVNTLTGQTDDIDRSDRCTPEPRNGSKPPKNLLNASSKTFQAQTSPPCWQCMNQAKNAKLST
jgi:hypothetical protein